LIPPDDYEFNPDRWLDPRRKGRLLHEVFEHTLSKARESNVAHGDRAFEKLALERLHFEVEQAKKEVPAPGEDAVNRELAGLEDDVRSFVRMVRKEGAPWEELEFGFGMGGEAPVSIEVEGGSIQLRGMIDRLDCPGGDLELEGIRVIDYKTGRNTRDFRDGTGVFNGGRRLQLGLYALAVEERLSRQVETGEYHYPTRGGQNELFSFQGDQLVEGIGSLVGHMLQGVAEGYFIPTENKEDCSYCDYSEVCRVEKSDYGGVTSSPLAEWSEKHLKDPALTPLKKIREFEKVRGSEDDG
jgi:ATP-dependent helicase/nuclease subunit B